MMLTRYFHLTVETRAAAIQGVLKGEFVHSLAIAQFLRALAEVPGVRVDQVTEGDAIGRLAFIRTIDSSNLRDIPIQSNIGGDVPGGGAP